MRWIIVFLFLYLVPLVIVFKNYKNFKRSCIYSSIYIVLVTTIVITNIYTSSLNKIKDAMYYESYVSEIRDDHKFLIKKEDIKTKEDTLEQEQPKYVEKDINNKENEDIAVDNQNLKFDNIVNEQKTDSEIILDFKKEIYDIETIALIPMRDCMPYTKNISENIKNLSNIKSDLEYAKEKCEEVIEAYNSMDIPQLYLDEDTKYLEEAKEDVKKAYELRTLAMESAIELVDSKNPKYVGKITQYLKLSDEHIANFKERIKDLNYKIENE